MGDICDDNTNDIDILIRIKVKGTSADFTVSPSAKKVQPGDQVRWVSPDGAFAIQFQQDTPIQQVDLRNSASERINGLQHQVTQTHVIRGDARGHYHYSLAVVKDGQVYIEAGCPELVVN